MKIIETFHKRDTDGRSREFCKISCGVCDTIFERPKRRLGTGFCSQGCKNIMEGSASIISCAVCDKNFVKSASKQAKSKSKLFFCCRICKDIGQRTIKEIQPAHYNNGDSNYREKAFKYYEPLCNRCGFENILALEVHHKDKNRVNNSIENLEILCANCHRIEHFGP